MFFSGASRPGVQEGPVDLADPVWSARNPPLHLLLSGLRINSSGETPVE